jgi:hypothetical protein
MKIKKYTDAFVRRSMDDLRRAIRPPRVYAGLAELLFVLFILGQLVDVVPYDNMIRDKMIGDVATGGGAVVFMILAVLSWRRKKREAMKHQGSGQHAGPGDGSTRA